MPEPFRLLRGRSQLTEHAGPFLPAWPTRRSPTAGCPHPPAPSGHLGQPPPLPPRTVPWGLGWATISEQSPDLSSGSLQRPGHTAPHHSCCLTKSQSLIG